MARAQRIDGQVWISKNAPHKLRYYAEGRDYTCSTLESYEVASNTNKIKKGMLLAINANKVHPARFPDDIDRIIGVATSNQGESGPSETSVDIAQNSYISFSSKEEIDAAFAYIDDMEVGSPVYWFIGTWNGGRNTHGAFVESAGTYDGFLTTITPSKYINVDPDDPAYDVDYDNLPLVGVVTSLTRANANDPASNIVSLVLQLNVSTFDTSFEWSWPRSDKYATQDADFRSKISSDGDFEIRHGFPVYDSNISENSGRAVSFIQVHGDIVSNTGAQESSDDANRPKVWSHANVLTGSEDSDHATKIAVSTTDNMYLQVYGQVHYKYYYSK